MNHLLKPYRQALLLQILLQLHINTTFSLNLNPQNVYNRYAFPGRMEEPINKELADTFPEERTNPFLRHKKSDNQPRMLNIDVSRLRKDTSLLHNRHKPPMSLVGIDVSVLSHNPDPTLPLAPQLPKDKMNGNFIMGYNFDSFDRLPIIRPKPIHTYRSIQPQVQEVTKENMLLPMMFVPLSVMTTFHSILDNKKQNTKHMENFNGVENELKHTADFILHVLHQLSSNYRKNSKK